MKDEARPRDPLGELAEAERTAQKLAQIIGPAFPPGWGFVLITMSFGPAGHMTYVSNSNREDVIKLLKETVQVLEKGEMAKPGVLGRMD